MKSMSVIRIDNSLFSSKEEVLQLISRSDDNLETKEIIEEIELIKGNRNPFYLNLKELDKILIWKLRKQYGRQLKIRNKNNTNSNVRLLTQAAFAITHPDKIYERTLKINTLRVLSGVEIPVASAILTLCYPERYAVIDVRNWRRIFPNDTVKSNYTISDYNKYIEELDTIAKRFDLSLREIDVAIWQYDFENGK